MPTTLQKRDFDTNEIDVVCLMNFLRDVASREEAVWSPYRIADGQRARGNRVAAADFSGSLRGETHGAVRPVARTADEILDADRGAIRIIPRKACPWPVLDVRQA